MNVQDLLSFIRRATDMIKLKVCGKQGVNPDAGLSRLTYLKIWTLNTGKKTRKEN